MQLNQPSQMQPQMPNIPELEALPAEQRFSDLYAAVVTPERQAKKADQEVKLLSQMIESKTLTGKTEPQVVSQAAASGSAKDMTDSTNKGTNVIFGGISEDLYREAKKRSEYKIQNTASGSMSEVDCRQESDKEIDPKKDKQHREFMFDLMALLVRLGLIKIRK